MGIGFVEVLIIVVVLLLIFGAGKIPKIAKDLGAGVREFKKGMKDEPDSGEKTANKLEMK